MPGCCHSRRTGHGKKRMENKSKAVKPSLLPSFQCHFIRSTGRGGGEGKGARNPSNQNTIDANTLKMCNCQQNSQRVSSLLFLGRAGCAHNSTMTRFLHFLRWKVVVFLSAIFWYTNMPIERWGIKTKNCLDVVSLKKQLEKCRRKGNSVLYKLLGFFFYTLSVFPFLF